MINKNPQNNTKILIANNQLMITVNPFDNFFKFTISKNDDDILVRYNLNDFTELKMTIKTPKKEIDFKVFRESSENDFENGVVVFKIPESRYKDIRELSLKTNVFYINGLDLFDNKTIIYTGFFNLWDSSENISRLESEFNRKNRNASALKFQNSGSRDKQNQVNQAINDGVNKETSANTSEISRAQQEKNKFTDLSNFRPRYRADDYAISIGLFEEANDKKPYREFDTKITYSGAAIGGTSEKTNFRNSLYRYNNFGFVIPVNQNSLNALQNSGNTNVFSSKDIFENYVEAYFKGLNTFPNDTVLSVWSSNSNLRNDLRRFVSARKFSTNEIIIGEFLPLTPQQKSYFSKANIALFLRPPSGGSTTSFNASTTNSGSTGNSTSNFANNGTSNSASSTSMMITGLVTTGANLKLESVEVKIISPAKTFQEYKVQTNSNGQFNLGSIDNYQGDVKIVFSKQGYVQKVVPYEREEIITAIADGGIKINIVKN